MSYVYLNANTGDEHHVEQRSPRLDRLDNWSLIRRPADVEPVITLGPERPTNGASKALWVAYAVAKGFDQADVEKLTRDELITEHG